jgi:hypothetical protein
MVEAYLEYIINGQKIFLHSFGDMLPSRPRKSEADFGCALLACHFTRNAPKGKRYKHEWAAITAYHDDKITSHAIEWTLDRQSS